ncbi:DUF6270 domain-containing protein [Aciduricibacillus chroicocephali]|uniref:DUF6270 domain-containing protein n=1 Tax=Aciduricibacillus chroicocephali TaxID=3054939 RepID=A0ABY9KWG0_9BACI|nr:DUF6270 domain-containing protein [Bacillaceae bacterium 44XB]
MKKPRIAVIGCCVTRDLFNRKFVANYKEFYECVSTAWQTSIISFMSNRSNIDEHGKEFVDEVSDLQRKTVQRDMDKSYREELIAEKPDYIIYDLYTDVKYGIVETQDGYLTDNPNGFRKTRFFTEKLYNRRLNIFKHEEFMELFNRKFDEFYKWVHKNLPGCRIIVTRFSETYSYMTDKGFPVNFSTKVCGTVARNNKMYDRIYDHLSENYNIDFIDMQKRTYFADYKHPYGNKPWHFTQQYYDDLFSGLNEVMLNHQQNEENTKLQNKTIITKLVEKVILK